MNKLLNKGQHLKLSAFTSAHIKTFERLGVESIYLFGSYADGTATPQSDVDFGVVFSDTQKTRDNYFRIYSDLYDIFIEILPEDYLKRRLEMHVHECDIVFLQQNASIRMRYKAVLDGKVLYQSSAKHLADFREKAMLEFFDYQYIEKIRNDAFINI